MGNPPYQMQATSTGQQGDPIYQYFWLSARDVAAVQSMVFLSTWAYAGSFSKGREIDEMQAELQDGRIIRVEVFSSKTPDCTLFPNAGTGPVSIVTADHNPHHSTRIFYDGLEVVTRTPADQQEAIRNGSALEEVVDLTSIRDMAPCNLQLIGSSGQGIAGIRTDNTCKMTPLRLFRDGMTINVSDYNLTDGQFLLVQNNRIGKGGSAAIYKMDGVNDLPTAAKNILNQWKVALNYRGVPTILPPRVVPGRIRPIIYSAPSKNLVDNFLSYWDTVFRCYLSQKSEQVPDLSEVENPRTHKIGWLSDWTDGDLKIVFKDVLTEDDWKHIEDAIAS